MTLIEETSPRERIVEAADRLFNARGVNSVGMDQLRDAAGVSLKRLYGVFPTKEDVILAVLEKRHRMWTDAVEARIAAAPDARGKVLAVYDFLTDWFRDVDFRGCMFINTFAELGATSPRVAAAIQEHKAGFQRRLADLVTELGGPPSLAAQLALLAEGAQTTAAISGGSDAAAQAREAAITLIDVALTPGR